MLCAYQFIYKYRGLKAKVIKTNFLGTQIHKHRIKTKFRLSDLDLKSSDSGTDLDSDLKSSDSGSDSDSGLGNFSYSTFSQLYLKIHFLRKQFKYVLMVWLLISLAAALYFHCC